MSVSSNVRSSLRRRPRGLHGLHAFGTDDVFIIADVPDHAAAIAMAAVVVSTSGAISRYETVILLTPAEVDKAMNVTVDYVPPGS